MIPSSLARHPLAPGSSLPNKLNTIHPKSTICEVLLPFHHCFTMATWFSGIYTARSCLPDTLHPMLPPGLPLYAFLLVPDLLGHVSLIQFILCIPLIFLPDGPCLPLCPHYAFLLPPNLCLPLVPVPARPSWSVVRLLPHVFLISVPVSWFRPLFLICLMYAPYPGLDSCLMPWSRPLPHVCLMSWSGLLSHALWLDYVYTSPHVCLMPYHAPHAFPSYLWLDHVYTDASPSL